MEATVTLGDARIELITTVPLLERATRSSAGRAHRITIYSCDAH